MGLEMCVYCQKGMGDSTHVERFIQVDLPMHKECVPLFNAFGEGFDAAWYRRGKLIGEDAWKRYFEFSKPSKGAKRNTEFNDWKGLCYFDLAVRYLGEPIVRARLARLEEQNVTFDEKHGKKGE